jgi:hypothetical protein
MNTPIPLFVGLFAALGLVYWIAQHTSHNITPSDVDDTWSPVSTFYRHRPGDASGDFELGGAWTSALDPGATFRLSWISETGELVALRHQAKATMQYNPIGIFGLGNVPTMNRRAEGMKVLARVSLRDARAAATPAVASAPDGLDRLTTALGRPYQPPPGAAEFAAARSAGTARHRGRRPADAEDVERHEHLIAAIPSVAAIVGVTAISAALVFGSSSIGAAALPGLIALGVLVVAGALATTTGNFTFSKILLRRTHRDHDEHRRSGRGDR